MMGTLGFFKPQEDMSEQLSQSWSLFALCDPDWSHHRGVGFPGRWTESLRKVWKSLCDRHDSGGFWIVPCQF